jgi:inosine-uridine nucleoside N-ribohydrolase
MRNFLIDTETASDDAVAIMRALADPTTQNRSVAENTGYQYMIARKLGRGFRVG